MAHIGALFVPLHRQVAEMARQRDSELERLGAAQNAAFQRMNEAYDTMQRAWDRRSSARDALNHAYEAKQRVHEEFDQSWQRLQSIRDANGPQIGSLNAQQEAAYQNMRRSFEAASSAHGRGDGASAKSLSLEGHAHKEESQRYVAERRQLVEEIRSVKAEHDAVRPAFERAKEDFHAVKQAHDRAKAEHEHAEAEFKKRKVEAEKAKQAFHKRLDYLKAQNKQRRDDRRSIAEKAGVPHQYLDNVKVRKNRDGSCDIFYGGAGAPDGLGHGHATLDRFGKATHDRSPFDSNSPENFADEESYIDFQQSKGHRGGYGLAHYGYIDGIPVTFAFGWGSKSGHTLLADGHVDKKTFHDSKNHNHYGPGQGPNENVKDRGQYTGPDS